MTASYLLDTDVVSNLRKARPHPRLVAWLEAIPDDAVFISVATVAEIQCGIGRIADPAVAQAVEQWLDGMLSDGRPAVADFNADAARLLGRMWATPSLDNFVRNDPRAKKLKNSGDLAVASIAIAYGMTVVSNNADHFLQIHNEFPLAGLFSPFDGVRHIDPVGL